VYGDDIREPGFNIRGYYNFHDERVCFGPEFTFFRKRREVLEEEQIDKSLFEFNFNGHYVFEITHKFGLYPLYGVNYSREREDITFFNTGEKEDLIIDKWGFNLGGGFHYFLIGDLVLFAEYDHLFSQLSQNTYSAGLFYVFGSDKKEQSHNEE
jgi:hypothetical protein